MINVITIAREYGSGSAELGRLVARKLGWELLDRQLVDRVARIADLDVQTAAQFDEQAARWWRGLLAGGISLAEFCPYVAPRWLDEIDEDSVHTLTTQLIEAAADSGGCVIAGRGAQCFLQGRAGVFNVLAYAPVEERIRTIQARWPECTDVPALLKGMDSQRARYIRHYYGRDWLDPALYHLCVNTSLGLDVAATLVNAAVIFEDKSCTPCAEKEVASCHLPL